MSDERPPTNGGPMRRPGSPPANAGPVAFLGVLSPHLIGVLIGASVMWERQRKVDGMPHDPELGDLITVLAQARPGPPGTSVDVEAHPVHSEDMDNRLLLTYGQVAARLGISDRHVKRLVSQGHLRRIKLGAAARVPAADLEAYVNHLRKDAT